MSVISEQDQLLVQRLMNEGTGRVITLGTGEKIRVRGFKAFATESRVLLGTTEEGEDVVILLDDIDSIDWPDPD